jgi:hypothetical protein
VTRAWPPRAAGWVRGRRGIALFCSAVLLASCAARAPVRPAGTATPDPTAADAFTQATRQCAGLKTVTGELRLSGRAGSERIRGTLHAGLAAPSSVRFEAVAPFGQPFFILAGRDNRAALVLPRDNRVLPDAAVSDVLERLTGLELSADDIRLILTGCLAEPAAPSEGRTWAGGWRGLTIGTGITAYVRNVAGVPVVVAADYGTWRIDYADHRSGWPRQVRIRSTESGIDLTAAIDQLEVNVPIDERAFAIAPPAGAAPITLDELRSVAPLKGSK